MNLIARTISAAALAGATALSYAAGPLVNLIGDQAPFIATIDVPDLVKSWKNSPWTKLGNDAQMQRFIAPILAKADFDEVDAKVKAETGHSLAELSELLTGGALIALTHFDAAWFEEDAAVPPILFAVEIGKNGSKIEKIITAAREKSELSFVETEDFAGVTLNIEKKRPDESEDSENEEEIGDDNKEFIWAITDGVWFGSPHKQTVIAAIDALKNGGADQAFGKSATYLKWNDAAEGAQVRFLINFRAFIPQLQEWIVQKTAQEPPANPMMNPTAIIPALGVDAWEQLYMNFGIQRDATVSSGGFSFAEERGLLKIFSYGEGPVARPAFIPAGWVQAGMAKFSFKKAYAALEEMIGAYNPGVLGLGQMYLHQFSEQTGVELKRDFFGNFGDDLLSGYAMRPGATEGTVEDFDQVVGISLADTKAFTAALDGLLKAAGPQAEKAITKRDYLGTTIHTVPVPAQPGRSLSFAIAKNYLFFSIGTPAGIEGVLQDTPAFFERRDVKQALESAPGNASSFSYTDGPAFLAALMKTFAQSAQQSAAAQGAEDAAEVFDVSATPDKATFSKYFGDGEGYLTRDSRSYFYKSILKHNQ